MIEHKMMQTDTRRPNAVFPVSRVLQGRWYGGPKFGAGRSGKEYRMARNQEPGVGIDGPKGSLADGKSGTRL